MMDAQVKMEEPKKGVSRRPPTISMDMITSPIMKAFVYNSSLDIVRFFVIYNFFLKKLKSRDDFNHGQHP